MHAGKVPIAIVAYVYGKDACWVRAGLISGYLPIGIATRNGKRITSISDMDSRRGRISYYVSPKKLYEDTGFEWRGEKTVHELHVREKAEEECMDYEERRTQDGRRKRVDSFGTRNSGTLERTSGTAPGAAEEGLSAAKVADHEPDLAGDYLHYGGGDLGASGGAGVRR